MRRNLFAFVALCAVIALTAQVRGQGGDDPSEGGKYVGEGSCKKCHIKVHRGWKKTPHAKAFETLPAKYHGEKTEDGVVCISCHVTGYGEADRGGFESVEASGGLLGVQCEACHGPGSNHMEAGQKVLDDKRSEFNEGEKTFIVKKTTKCSNCHNPHVDYEKYKEG